MELLLPILAVIAGFAALVWGADRFIEGAAATAQNLGISPLIIGLTIVGFGTSAPEMLVSTLAAADGNEGLAVGNAVGSNITNVALILGVSACVAPLTVHSKIISREIPLLLFTMLLALALLLDGNLSQIDGAILLGGLAVLMGWIVSEGLRERRTSEHDPIEAEIVEELPDRMSNEKALLWVAVGLAVLLGSARLIVWGASSVAVYFGVPNLVIGLTIVALGTSLPELAASVASALKNEHDIAIGNVVGSNMFNLLGVLALPGLIHPGEVNGEVLTRDMPVMFGVTILLWIKARGFMAKSKLTRFNGIVLVATYVGYIGWLVYETVTGTAVAGG